MPVCVSVCVSVCRFATVLVRANCVCVYLCVGSSVAACVDVDVVLCLLMAPLLVLLFSTLHYRRRTRMSSGRRAGTSTS